MAYPFAARCGLFPGQARFEVFFPPGEGAALLGAVVVNGAAVVFQKDAVEIFRIFFQGKTAADLVSITADKFFRGDIKKI